MKKHSIKKLLLSFIIINMFILSSCQMVWVGGEGGGNIGDVELPKGGSSVVWRTPAGERVEITHDNIEKTLKEIPRPEGFVWENKVTFTDSTVTREIKNKIFALGDMVRVENYENGVIKGTFIIRDGNTYAFDKNMAYYYKNPVDSVSYDALASVAQMGDFYPKSGGQIINSSIVVDERGNILMAEMMDKTLPIIESYEFSLDYGVPFFVESRLDGDIFYTLTTEKFSEEEIAQIQFEIPTSSRERI